MLSNSGQSSFYPANSPNRAIEMSRYRPAPTKSSPYITAAGHEALEKELRYLWKEKRPEVTKRVAAAAALGDRSENADYIYGKRQLADIDRRIRYLSTRLDELTVVDRLPKDMKTIYFGAWVTLEVENGETRLYRIVGPDEFDRQDNYISMDAPIARSMIGKRIGDSVAVQIGDAKEKISIIDIHYES